VTTEDFSYRFGGIGRLYGNRALSAFRTSHVAVVGLGGVGSWAAEALARSGVGRLSLFDLDDICASNVNRQIHALNGTIGQLKVEAMAQRLRAIQPSVEVGSHACFVTEKNLSGCLTEDLDFVFDATDSVKAKVAMIAWCAQKRIPLITSGAAGGQIDPTRIQIADLSRTFQDALLARVRSDLRRHHGFPRDQKCKFGVDAVFSSEQPRYATAGGDVCATRPEQESGPVKLDCASGFGAATHVTATFAFFAVSRILARLAVGIA
jgi:tRNA A37 threonylcarbamoyladenosine dehydratase